MRDEGLEAELRRRSQELMDHSSNVLRRSLVLLGRAEALMAGMFNGDTACATVSASPSRSQAPGAAAQAVPRPVRVLLAEDSRAERRLLRWTLEDRGGFTVIGEAEDGSDAVQLAVRERPDVVLLDIAMPIMDGLEAAPEIRRRAPGTRILILSAYSATRMEEQALAAGADAYVEKSSAKQALLDTIRELCSRTAPKAAAGVAEAPAPAAQPIPVPRHSSRTATPS